MSQNLNIFGPPNLEKLKKKKDINGLQKALFYDKDRQIRLHAAKVLGDLGDDRASDSLAQVLAKEKDTDVRYWAAIALAKLKDIRAIEPIVSYVAFKGLYKSKTDYSYYGDLIVGIGEPAIKALAGFLGQYQPRSITAIKFIVMLGNKKAIPELINFIRECKKWRGITYTRGNTFKDLSFDQRVAIWALGEIGDETAIESLIEEALDPKPELREEAVTALEKLGANSKTNNISIEQKINIYLIKKDVKSLAALGDEGLDLLNNRLNNSYKAQFPVIAQTLSRLNNPKSLPFLIKAFAFVEDKSNEKKALIRAVSKFGKTAINELLNAINNVDSAYDNYKIKPAIESANILAVMKENRAIKPLINMLELGGIAQNSAVRILTKFEANDELIEELKKAKTENRIVGLIQTLNSLGEKRMIPVLNEILKNKKLSSLNVRNKIIYSLKNLTDQDFGDDLQSWKNWLDNN